MSVFVSLAVCASCSDEAPDTYKGSDILSFSPAIANENSAQSTHSAARQVKREAFKFTNSDMWIISAMEDGINEPECRTASRAAAVDKSTFYHSFKVLGYVIPAGESWGESSGVAQIYINNEEVTQGTDSWSTASPHYWPGAKYDMKFFAYAPCDMQNASVTTTNNTPTITYTVPNEVAEQKDLLIADDVEISPASSNEAATYSGTVPGDYKHSVNLHFYHALTAVKIKAVGELTGKVTGVRLSGIKGSGSYEFGADTWNTDETEANATFSQNLNVELPGNSTDYQPVTDGETTFMMIPQTLRENATLEVTFDDGTVLKGSLAGKEWPMGKTISYRISKSNVDYTFDVTPLSDFSYSGGNQSYTVTSYKNTIQDGSQLQEPVQWHIAESAYSIDGGITWTQTKPTWLSALTTTGTVNAEETACEASVSAQKSIIKSYKDNLREQSPVGGPYDLSTRGGTTAANTANCYIINAPGTYSLPLVYGNAIKNGKDNRSAYTSTSTGDNILKTFLNHLDQPIESPYISKNTGCTPVDATLVWQDAKDLITPGSVKLSTDKESLIFDIPQSTIKQGNAIVAVRDNGGNIMWSWHIWVTDYHLDDDIKVVTNHSNVKYQMMPINIGWCANGTLEYAARSVLVKIVQEGSNNTAIITINQAPHTGQLSGSNPYFQFGRKDPMLSNTLNNSNSLMDNDCYYTENYKFNPSGQGKVSIGTSIQNPHIFYNHGNSSPYDWCNASYLNLWNANSGATTPVIVKTIYDPSPAGYNLPPLNIFTGFTTTGGDVTSIDMVNGIWDIGGNNYSGYGWQFYCENTDGTASTTFFPALGCRTNYNGTLNVPYIGYYWKATALSVNTGGAMQCFWGGVNPMEVNFHRSYGFAARAIKEDL